MNQGASQMPALFGLPAAVIEKLREVFKNDARIKQVWLYGSRAMGRQRAASDIDLCVEGESLGVEDLFAMEMQIEALDLPWKVDLSLKHKIDNPALIHHIEEVGVSFYERSFPCS